jgi:hypothetical protein
MSHTQGKLKANGSERSLATWLEAESGKRVATMKQGETDWGDACRLAACWNACEGISTDALETEGSAVMGWVRTSSKLIAATTQRDELLEALKSAIKTAEFERHPLREWHTLAKAAIAKAEGTL